MSLVLVGLNHTTAPIEVRERFAFGAHELPEALSSALAVDGSGEAVLLSTCNRTEFYFHPASDVAVERIVEVLARKARLLPRAATSYLSHQRDQDAVRHLFRVTASLDSMILGEPQIQGQVREAYERARAVAYGGRSVGGAVFHRLFQSALAVGGRVRSETRLAEGAASVPLAAVELARKIFGTLRGRRVMVVGGGEMGELSLRGFLDEGVAVGVATSRQLERAQALAARVGGEAVSFDAFWRALPSVDIVVASSAAPHPVITLERVREVLPHGPGRPLCIIDIAVPRDVEPAVAEMPNVFLYNIDDLKHIVTTNLERRQAEIPRAERIVGEAATAFWHWYTGLQAVPLIRELRDRAEALRQEEVDRWLSRLSHLPPEDRERVERLTRSLLRKLLHVPTTRLREAAEGRREAGLLDAARKLFDVDSSNATSE